MKLHCLFYGFFHLICILLNLILSSTTLYALKQEEIITLKKRIDFIESCVADSNSRWIDGKCYYFLRKLYNYDEAKV